jgi:Asp-tRNA(Asn)/Glu-tRNA(Gln) amidotransferase A subunit family amidase
MPVADPQDTVGPMARTVRDVALLLTVLAAPDAGDPATTVAERPQRTDFTAMPTDDALRGARLGVARDMMGTHEGGDAVIDSAIDALRDLGAEIVDPVIGTCRRMSRIDGIDKVLAEHRLDAIIAPTDGTPPWAIDLLVGDHIIGGASAPPAMAGYPHVTVPAGMCHGLPTALSFIGAAWHDAQLLSYAYAFEQATQARRTPAFAPTVT